MCTSTTLVLPTRRAARGAVEGLGVPAVRHLCRIRVERVGAENQPSPFLDGLEVLQLLADVRPCLERGEN